MSFEITNTRSRVLLEHNRAFARGLEFYYFAACGAITGCGNRPAFKVPLALVFFAVVKISFSKRDRETERQRQRQRQSLVGWSSLGVPPLRGTRASVLVAPKNTTWCVAILWASEKPP